MYCVLSSVTWCTLYFLEYLKYCLLSSVPDVLIIILYTRRTIFFFCTRCTVYYLAYPMYYLLSIVPDVLFII